MTFMEIIDRVQVHSLRGNTAFTGNYTPCVGGCFFAMDMTAVSVCICLCERCSNTQIGESFPASLSVLAYGPFGSPPTATDGL